MIEVIKKAQADLGRDLGGLFLSDLLADNFTSLPLKEIKRLIRTYHLEEIGS